MVLRFGKDEPRKRYAHTFRIQLIRMQSIMSFCHIPMTCVCGTTCCITGALTQLEAGSRKPLAHTPTQLK